MIDDGSTDATAEVAGWEGARVLAVDDVLPELPDGSGKGNALWMSLYACDGDIVCWLDADVRNFGSHFVTRLLEPLLTDPAIGFVKGYYRRPLHGEPTGGGRVTELMARPLLSALFPHLAGFVQPLAGEYAGRRALLETVPFVEGWGVELGLLIDLVANFGIDAIAQVDLDVREHRNRPLEELGPQAMAILVTGLRRAGVPVDKRLAELVRYDDEQHARARRGGDPRAAADDHRPGVPRQVRSRALGLIVDGRWRHSPSSVRRPASTRGLLHQGGGAGERLARLPHPVGEREQLEHRRAPRSRRALRR